MEHYVQHVTLTSGLVVSVRPWGALREAPRRAEWMEWLRLSLRLTGEEAISEADGAQLDALTRRLLRASLDDPEDTALVITPHDEAACIEAMWEVNQLGNYLGKVMGTAAKAMQLTPPSPHGPSHTTPTGGAS